MFTDGRSRRVVFLAHCLLNQNAISDGTAEVPADSTDSPGCPGRRGAAAVPGAVLPGAGSWRPQRRGAAGGGGEHPHPPGHGPAGGICPAAGADGSGCLADSGVPEARICRAGHRRCGPLPLLRGEHHLGSGPGTARPGRVYRISPGGTGVGRADRTCDRHQAVGAGGAGPGTVPSGE